MVRAGLFILSGNAATSLMLLVRNLLVARLIPVTDYGIAATFAIAMAAVEMASALGLQQQIVQARDGDDPRFQAALQGFQVLRGALAAAALFFLATPLAGFLGVPEVAWAYQLLACVPLLNALQHFDIHRLNREMVFAPVVLTGAVPALVSLILVWPLAAWLQDYRVMLWAIIAQAVLMTLFSHLTARRRYALVWDRAVMGESLRFGWPLLVNGLLLFVVFQGDKLIIGRVMGMEVLALFAMGVTLTLTPSLVMAKSAQNFLLPQLSQAADPTDLARVTLETGILMAVVLTCGLVLCGPWLIDLILGAKYADLTPLLLWFALLQALRVLKAGPAIVAMAAGETSNAMWANLVRIAVLPLVWWLAVAGMKLELLIGVGILGEALGYGVALGLLMRRCAFDIRPVLLGHLGLALVLGVAVMGGGWVTLLAAGGFALWTLPHLRAHIRR